MSAYFVATGLLFISSLFIGGMWLQLIRKALQSGDNNIITRKLIVTGLGLLCQAFFLVMITVARTYQIVTGTDTNLLVGIGMFGLVVCDFLFIFAASLSRPHKYYLSSYLVVCALWLFVTVAFGAQVKELIT